MYYNFNREHPELIGSSSGDHLYVGVWAMLPIEIIVHLGLDYKVLCRILLGKRITMAWKINISKNTTMACKIKKFNILGLQTRLYMQ